ncbi:MAG: CAP domain-containing protein [Byssovorax sp.]
MNARAALAFALTLAPLLAGCPRRDEAPPPPPPGYVQPGQWTPPPQPTPAQPSPWQPAPGAGFPLPLPGLPGGIPGLPGFGGSGSPVPVPFADPAQRCVDVINQYRASAQLPPLSRWIFNESCVNAEARDAAATGQPHGAFGRCTELAQNVCPAWAGPADRMIAPCIQSQWAEGPGGDFAAHGHYLNLSSPRYTKVACGYFTAPNGQVWAVQDFQ